MYKKIMLLVLLFPAFISYGQRNEVEGMKYLDEHQDRKSVV